MLQALAVTTAVPQQCFFGFVKQPVDTYLSISKHAFEFSEIEIIVV